MYTPPFRGCANANTLNRTSQRATKVRCRRRSTRSFARTAGSALPPNGASENPERLRVIRKSFLRWGRQPVISTGEAPDLTLPGAEKSLLTSRRLLECALDEREAALG